MENYIFEKLNINIMKKNLYTGKKVKVAVIDGGINSINEKLNLSGGYNFIDDNENYADNNGHGTLIASIISGRNIGIAVDAEVYALKVKLEFNYDSVKMVIRAIEWCIVNKIDIINMSFGFAGLVSNDLEKKCNEAAEKGIIIICAAGNNKLSQGIEIPGKYNSVITVSGVNKDNTRYTESSFGKSVDFCCYCEELQAYNKTGDIINVSGTSYAAACVSAVVALLKQQQQSLTFREIYELLKENSIKLDNNIKSLYYGYGLIQAFFIPKEYKNNMLLCLDDLRKNIYFESTQIKIPLFKKTDTNIKYLPDNEYTNVEYSITDTSIAVVDGDGFVTGIKEGCTDLIAVLNRSKAAVCSVKVIKEEANQPEPDDENKLFNFEEMNIYTMHKNNIKGKGIKIGLIGYGCIETDLINVKQTITIANDNTKDANGFGTIYASIISGKEIGIAPEAELYIIKCATNGGLITWTNAEKAVRWCIENKMDIINMGFLEKDKYEKYLKKCYENNIIVVTNASSNLAAVCPAQTSEYSVTVSYVTDKKEFISKGKARTPFMGDFIDCVSYGYGIKCMDSENKQIVYSEGKAPVAQYYCNIAMMQVMAILALIKQQDFSINNSVKVRQLLSKLCESLYGGKNNNTGYGFLKAELLINLQY